MTRAYAAPIHRRAPDSGEVTGIRRAGILVACLLVGCGSSGGRDHEVSIGRCTVRFDPVTVTINEATIAAAQCDLEWDRLASRLGEAQLLTSNTKLTVDLVGPSNANGCDYSERSHSDYASATISAPFDHARLNVCALGHEVAHILVQEWAGEGSTWGFQEGSAEAVSADYEVGSDRKRLLAAASALHLLRDPVPLMLRNPLLGALSYNRNDYWIAGSLVAYLVEVEGTSSLRRYLARDSSVSRSEMERLKAGWKAWLGKEAVSHSDLVRAVKLFEGRRSGPVSPEIVRPDATSGGEEIQRLIASGDSNGANSKIASLVESATSTRSAFSLLLWYERSSFSREDSRSLARVESVVETRFPALEPYVRQTAAKAALESGDPVVFTARASCEPGPPKSAFLASACEILSNQESVRWFKAVLDSSPVGSGSVPSEVCSSANAAMTAFMYLDDGHAKQRAQAMERVIESCKIEHVDQSDERVLWTIRELCRRGMWDEARGVAERAAMFTSNANDTSENAEQYLALLRVIQGQGKN